MPRGRSFNWALGGALLGVRGRFNDTLVDREDSVMTGALSRGLTCPFLLLRLFGYCSLCFIVYSIIVMVVAVLVVSADLWMDCDYWSLLVRKIRTGEEYSRSQIRGFMVYGVGLLDSRDKTILYSEER